MKSKRKFLISALVVVLTAALAVGVFFFYKAFKKRIDPEEQMEGARTAHLIFSA